MMLRANPTVHVPPWPMVNDPTTEIFSPLTATNADYDHSPFYLQEALEQYAPSDADSDPGRDSADVYSFDQFRMFEFKVRNCARGRSHDWTECPYAHPGEKARRRDPRKYHYSGASCADFHKGSCMKGDACEFAHGVFECWLHPARYRTQPCKDGTSCRRRVCFFAHTPEQLRVLPQHSPRPRSVAFEFQSACAKKLPASSSSSHGSVSPPAETATPPMSPVAQSLCSSSVGVSEMVASLCNLQLGRVKSLPSSWNMQMGSPRFGSPRGPVIRPGFCSLPSTPTQVPPGRGSVNYFDLWDQRCEEEEPVMERVESGRGIRAKMFEKLSKENSLDSSGSGQEDGAPNVG